MNFHVIVLGAGGHSKVLIDSLSLSSIEVLGIADVNPLTKGSSFMGLPVIGGDEEVMKYSAENTGLVNGVGSVRVITKRRLLFEQFKRMGYQFFSVVHPSAVIAFDAVLSEGVQIMAGVVIQSGCHIGINAIINTHASIDHDCFIGAHAHISPGVTLSGGVSVGDGAYIGAGATVIQGIKVGRESLVAAGAVVVRDVRDGAKRLIIASDLNV